MIQPEMTEDEMDEIQEDLREIIRPLQVPEAELMALHFGFDTSARIQATIGMPLADWKKMVVESIDKYLEGNPYGGSGQEKIQ